MHPSDGHLRPGVDDPGALAPAVRRHVASCARCRARLSTLERDAERVRLALAAMAAPAAQGAEESDVAPARRRLAARAGAASARGGKRPRLATGSAGGSPATRWAAWSAAAAALVAAVAFTPVGSYATQLLTVFEPQQVVAVPLPDHPFATLPDLRDYGTMVLPQERGPVAVADAAQAQAMTGLEAPLVKALPPGLGAPAFEVMARATAEFTFRAAKARAAAARAGGQAPPMPPGLDGTTIRASVGPAIAVRYAPPGGGAQGAMASLWSAVVAAPQVTSTGASASEIEGYLLSLPGVSPALAADIRAVQDPVHTLPLPIPAGQATSTPVRVDGVPGVAVGDRSGLYNAVVWERSGRIYAVAGPYTAAQLLAAAASVGAP